MTADCFNIFQFFVNINNHSTIIKQPKLEKLYYQSVSKQIINIFKKGFYIFIK